MPSGPLQLLVIGFDQRALDRSITAVLAPLREGRVLRLIDALAVHKDSEGAIWSVEWSDPAEEAMAQDASSPTGGALAALLGQAATAACSAEAAACSAFGIAPQDILAIAERIPAGRNALLLLLEHAWLLPLRDALCATEDAWLATGFSGIEPLRGLFAALDGSYAAPQWRVTA